MPCHAKPAQAWQRSPNKTLRSDRDYHLTACENVSDVTLVIANSGETLRGLGMDLVTSSQLQSRMM